MDKGEIDPRARATCELRAGVLERWDGHRGFGPLNARRAMERACVLAKENGVGLVALGNNNHWLRGGYLWLAGSRQRLHRHLLVQHNAQYARMGRERPQDRKQPVRFGGASLRTASMLCWTARYPSFLTERSRTVGCGACSCPCRAVTIQKGNSTRDPAEIEKTGRVLPMGYWKGSGLSIVLATSSPRCSRQAIRCRRFGTFGDEVGLTQVMIAIDPQKFNTAQQTDAIVDAILADVKASEPVEEGGQTVYPG